MNKIIQRFMIVAVGLSVASFCQAAWPQYVHTGTGASVKANAMAEDSSGNVYVLGTRQGGTDTNMVVMKFDSSGTYLASQEYGGSGDEVGFDIVTRGSTAVYILGKLSNNQLYVLKLTTGLSVTWQKWITPLVPGGGSSLSCLPYKLSHYTSPTGDFQLYVTAQTQTNTTNNYDLTNPSNPSAIYFAAFDSESSTLRWQRTWQQSSTSTERLFGMYALSNGLTFVSQSNDSTAGTRWVRTVKSSTAGAGIYSVAAPLYSGYDSLGINSCINGTTVYTSYTTVDLGVPTVETVSAFDMSATTTPSWSLLSYHIIPQVGSQSAALGVAYWNGNPVSLGNGYYTSGSTTFSSWLRYDLNADTGSFIDSSASSWVAFRPMVPATPDRYRCFDAYSNVAGFCRANTTTSYDIVSFKAGASPITQVDTKTIPGSYTLDTQPAQAMASKVSNSIYSLQTVTNAGDYMIGLEKVTR